MTTVDKVHNIFMSFKGRSPRKIYTDACADAGAKINSQFEAFLSDTVDDFYQLEDLDLSGNYFGPKGCLAVLKIVQSQQRLKSLNLSSCGLDDIVVAELVEVMQDHPRLRDVSLCDNPNISVFSAKGLARVVKLNSNLINLDLSGTHVGRNVANVLHERCGRNRLAMEQYFSDDWFRMKDMFIGLDVDGSGWVNIKNLVGSVIFPLVQEKLEARIATMKPKKREDNCIDVTTFMHLTYLNFKTKEDIIIHSENSRDAVYDTIVGNWASLLKAIKNANARCSHIGKVAVRDYVLSDAQAKVIVADAIETQKQVTQDMGDAAEETVNITAPVLLQAIKKRPLTLSTPLGAKRKQSFLCQNDTKTHKLPPSFARLILEAFESAPPNGLHVRDVLSKRFETEMEYLNLEPFFDEFQRYSVPIDITLLTMEETYNLFDEYYGVIRVSKFLAEDAVQKLVDA